MRVRRATAFLAAFVGFAGEASAQGLAPPSTGPSDTVVVSSQPESTRLSADEKKDSGRGLEWVYLNANAGVSYMSLDSFSNSNLAVSKSSSAGPAFGFGAGIRLFIVTLGAQAAYNDLSSFKLWQLDAVLGFHIPLGHWDPYFGLHGGYAFSGGSLDQGISGSPNLSVTGGDGGLQVGVDYYFNHFVSVGIDVSGQLLFLHRPPASLPAGVTVPTGDEAAYQATGDSIGFGVAPTLHLGFHL